MKKLFLPVSMIFIGLFSISGCGSDDAEASTFASATAIGDVVSVSAGGETFRMIYANNQASVTIPTGVDDDGTAEITTKFFMGETQVTYALWYAVRQWAVDNGYSFENPGREGSMGTDGAEPTANSQHPVTRVS